MSEKTTLVTLKAEIELLKAEIEQLKTKSPVRNRGPESTREMTEDDARRIMIGDLKDAKHKVAAEELGLSYGQVYSARGGYTFKGVYAEMKKLEEK